jgi:hypothetical protein
MRSDEQRPDKPANSHAPGLEAVIAEIVRSITSVRFGSIEITIHDSRVVQIERKEKVRFAPALRAGPD